MKRLLIGLFCIFLSFAALGDPQTPTVDRSSTLMDRLTYDEDCGCWQMVMLASDGSDITDPASGSLNVQVVNPNYFRYTDVTLLQAAQTLTGSWADLGSEVSCAAFARIGGYFTVDVNNSLDVRIRALAKHTSAGADEYTFPILTPTASQVNVEAEFIEFTKDEDQKMFIKVECDNVVPYVQFQIQAGTPDDGGGTVGTVAASITKGY
jgi:hypothetical protein